MKIFSQNSKKQHLLRSGFTLIELLVVIGVLAILLAITLVAINPARQFQQARDTQRRSDVTAILNAVGQFYIDQGELPGDGLGPGGTDLITTTEREISDSEVNICALIVTLYLAALPVDPSVGDEPVSPCTPTYNTGYTIWRTADNRVTVSATSELNPLNPIEVTR